MSLAVPIDIMLECCIPDKKKLLNELGRLSPGETLQVKIDNSLGAKTLVEGFLKNQCYRIVDTIDQDNTCILHISMDRDLWLGQDLLSRKQSPHAGEARHDPY